MKKFSKTLLFLFFLAISACQKEPVEHQSENDQLQAQTAKANLSIEEARSWLSAQSDTILKKYSIRWDKAKSIPTKLGNRIKLKLPGSPTINGIKLGYRQLSIEKDLLTQKITAKILEILPDALYWQDKQKVDGKDFTGRIMEYDLAYHLTGGKIYAAGKQVGETRPSTQVEKQAYLANETPLSPLGGLQQSGTSSPGGKLSLARVVESCYWYQTSYVDSEGIFTVYAERICSYAFYDDDGGYTDQGIGTDPQVGGGGGGTQNNPPPPEPAVLPMEQQASVDPKKMMECFSNITSPSAAYQVKVLVLEPQPGTSFNVGMNSFGHVAIQLTKSGNGQLITQTIGFYPTGSGLDKLVSKSRMIDNGGLEYTMSSTFWTDAQSFQKVIDYISDPPKDYHYINFNCAAFVYAAGKAGNLPIPDPTTQVGFAGPGGAGSAMTPQGMASALDSQKAASPNSDISRSGGRAPASKGPCN